MRRTTTFALTAVLAIAAVFALGGRSTYAQNSAPSPTAGQQVLTPYLLNASNTPPALQQQDVTPLDNVTVAAYAQDPTAVQNILNRARIDGLEQDFGQTNGSPDQIQLQLSLFRDAAGAQADVADPVLLAGLGPSATSAPSLGDTSAGFTTKAASFETTNIGFSAGRLEVLITEIGRPDTTKTADIMPLADLMATLTKTPPPPPSDAELAVLQTQTSPESILHDAYTLLIENYLQKLPPSQLLNAAYKGAADALTAAGASNVPPAPNITSTDEDGGWNQFIPAYKQLEQLAPSSITAAQLEGDAANAMYSNLNCHTSYFTQQQWQREMQDLSGAEEARIGILIQKFPNAPYTILQVQPNTPAEAAGLMPGDEILAINHQTPDQVGEQQFSQLFQGPAGSSIVLTIQRLGQPQPLEFTIVRQNIPTIVERHKALPGGIGYIEFDDFTDGNTAYNDVKQALQDFQSAGNVTSWLMDLRYNSGGNEDTMRRIAGLFVAPGSLLVTETQQDGTTDQIKAVGPQFPEQKSMVLLVSQDTASAAEIFAQSLKDLGRVTIVGEPTSGCVNGGLPLALLDGSGVFVSTILVLSGPNQVALENVGITPDERVDLTLQDVQTGQDPQLAAAVALFHPAVSAGRPAGVPSSRRPASRTSGSAPLGWR